MSVANCKLQGVALPTLVPYVKNLKVSEKQNPKSKPNRVSGCF